MRRHEVTVTDHRTVSSPPNCRAKVKLSPDWISPASPLYQRYGERLPRCVTPLAALFTLLKGACGGISMADTSVLAVCDNTLSGFAFRIWASTSMFASPAVFRFRAFLVGPESNRHGVSTEGF
jgi:hypothetical protein